MGNEAHLLAPEVAAAATAIANARAGRRGAPPLTNVLDILPERLFTEVVEDARAAIFAAATVADAVPPTMRPRGPLNAADASALGLELRAGTLVILSRDRASRASAVIWAAGVSAAVLPDDEAQQLWAAFTAVARTLAGASPA